MIFYLSPEMHCHLIVFESCLYFAGKPDIIVNIKKKKYKNHGLSLIGFIRTTG